MCVGFHQVVISWAMPVAISLTVFPPTELIRFILPSKLTHPVRSSGGVVLRPSLTIPRIEPLKCSCVVPDLALGMVKRHGCGGGWSRSTDSTSDASGYDSSISSEPGQGAREGNGETGTSGVGRDGRVLVGIRCPSQGGMGWEARDGTSGGQDGEREQEGSEKGIEEHHIESMVRLYITAARYEKTGSLVESKATNVGRDRIDWTAATSLGPMEGMLKSCRETKTESRGDLIYK